MVHRRHHLLESVVDRAGEPMQIGFARVGRAKGVFHLRQTELRRPVRKESRAFKRH